MPNMLTADAVFEAWQPDNIGLRPKIAAWNECDTVIFTELLEDDRGRQSARGVHAERQGGLRRAIDRAAALRRQ